MRLPPAVGFLMDLLVLCNRRGQGSFLPRAYTKGAGITTDRPKMRGLGRGLGLSFFRFLLPPIYYTWQYRIDLIHWLLSFFVYRFRFPFFDMRSIVRTPTCGGKGECSYSLCKTL